jgi:hypothetical protein
MLIGNVKGGMPGKPGAIIPNGGIPNGGAPNGGAPNGGGGIPGKGPGAPNGPGGGNIPMIKFIF